MKNWFPVLPILALALGLRLLHLNQIYVFGADEEYQINIAMTLVRHLHPIWIGVSAANTGFYLGPAWSYFTYIWLLLSKGDPLITAYVAAFLGTITTLVVFYVGWKMFSKKVGIVASLLYACLPLTTFFDQKYWNPSLVPLLSLLLIFSLYKKNWLLFALSYGLVFHTHLSLVPILFLALYRIREGIEKRTLALAVVLFILITSPLIIFDYFHKWSNITTPLRFNELIQAPHPLVLEKAKSLGESIMRLWYLNPNSINASEILSACSKYRSSPSLLAIPFLILILIFFFKKKTWQKENTKLLALGILIISLSYIFFPGRGDEYYLLGLFPLLLFIPGILWNKKITPILVGLACILGSYTIISSYNPYGLEAKKQIINQVMKALGNEPFELEEDGKCHKYEGWRYLFSTYARAPERSSIDLSFGWLYPMQIHKETEVKYSVVITGNDTGKLGFTYQIIRH